MWLASLVCCSPSDRTSFLPQKCLNFPLQPWQVDSSHTMLPRSFLGHMKGHGSLIRSRRTSGPGSPIRTTGLFSCRRQHQNAFPPPRFAEYLPPPKPQWKDKSKAVRYSTIAATGIATVMALSLEALFWYRTERAPMTGRKRPNAFPDGFGPSSNEDRINLDLRQLGIADMSLILCSTSILSDNHPSTVTVKGILEKILRSNGLRKINYLEVHVVDMVGQ